MHLRGGLYCVTRKIPSSSHEATADHHSSRPASMLVTCSTKFAPFRSAHMMSSHDFIQSTPSSRGREGRPRADEARQNTSRERTSRSVVCVWITSFNQLTMCTHQTMRPPLFSTEFADAHSTTSLFEANQCFNLYSMLLHHALVSSPVVNDSL